MLMVSFSLEMYTMLYLCDLLFLFVLPTTSKNIVLVVFRLLVLKSEFFLYTQWVETTFQQEMQEEQKEVVITIPTLLSIM